MRLSDPFGDGAALVVSLCCRLTKYATIVPLDVVLRRIVTRAADLELAGLRLGSADNRR